MIGPLTEEQRR